MKFLLDSCISGFAAKELRNAGFDILWIPEAGKDPGDEEIIKKAFIVHRKKDASRTIAFKILRS